MRSMVHVVTSGDKALGAFRSEREAIAFQNWYVSQHGDAIAVEVSSVGVSKSAKTAAMALCGIPSKV